MALEFRSNTVSLSCDTCKRGSRSGRGTATDPYTYNDPPDALYRATVGGKTVWVCEECFWELVRKELS